ncbi:unnamed protein product [Acanthocheilonema viteae]|uniref:SprT-like domain-containing protein n=1 Tax=Acanthocheilonema viteae TaxID=6277 RepID=A0A498SCB5_ACAVI|nr:unnamed protein product [Acanthocheilonema viteae]
MSQYRRIVIDDSSSDDGDDNDGDSDKDVDKTENNINESDEDSDSNIENVSRLLETLSFTKRRNNYGHRVDRSDDEATSIDEDTYLEDSFLIKDYTSEENFSNTSSDEQSFRKNESTHNRQQQEMRTAEISSFFRNDLSDISIDNEKISTLFELYPELRENVIPTEKSLSNDSIEIRSEFTKFDEDSDEKFEKCTLKFIMSDSECTVEYSSEYEFNSSDNFGDAQLIDKVLRNIGGEKIPHHHTPKNVSSEHGTHWHHPTKEKKMKQRGRANLHLSLQNAPNIQRASQDDDEIFLLALSPNGPVHWDAQRYTTVKFSRVREKLAARLFDLYRRRCFENKLDPNMVLEWNSRLRLTAGRCRCKSNGTVDIELSSKVCDTPERLRDTLLHEMCHAAVWVIDRIQKGGHGSAWKYWVYQSRKVFPSLPLIGRCHNYTVDAKYLYICDRCGQTIKRHSKSLDIVRKICGICQGHFILRSRDGKKFSTRSTNIFAQFVKENYKKERKPGVKHAEIMKILSLRFKEEKGMASETGGIITAQ